MGSRRSILCWYYYLATTSTRTTAATSSLGAWVAPLSLNRPSSVTAASFATRILRNVPLPQMFSTSASSESEAPPTAIESPPEENVQDNVGQKDIGLRASNEKRGVVDSSYDGKLSWRSLIERSIAKSRNVRGGNYVQLATVDATTLEARCRTVVFRGFLNLPLGHSHSCTSDGMACVMKMITHHRSAKVAEISQNSKAEMVWWFSQTSEQYRIRGRILLVGNHGLVGADPVADPVLDQARREQWGNLRDGAREEYFRVPTPGATFEIETQPVPPGGRDESTGKLLPIPDDFLLMLLVPTRVDYLRLTNMYRQIEERREGEDGAWILQRVNP